MQVCVPSDYTDEQIVEFAEAQNSCGTTNGWFIRREGSESLADDPERAQCSSHPENVHITLDA